MNPPNWIHEYFQSIPVEHELPLEETAERESSSEAAPDPPECDMESDIETTFTDLPDELMMAIFKDIRLHDLLLHVPGVSLRWAELQPDACRLRRSLTLLLGNGAQEFLLSVGFKANDYNSLVQRELKKGAVTLLTGKLTRVRNLVICMTSIKQDEVEQVIRLLRSWSSQLTSLTLVMRHTNWPWVRPSEAESEQLLRLLVTLNSMAALRSVTIFVHGYICSPFDPERRLLLSFMARLEFCYFYSRDNVTLLLDAVDHYFGRNPDARSLILSNPRGETERLLQLSPRVTSLMRHIKCYDIWALEGQLVDQLGRFFGKFRNLTDLTMNLFYLPIPDLVRRLQSLHGLTSLRVVFECLAYNLVNYNAKKDLPQLPGVKHMQIHAIIFCQHSDLDALHLEVMFPNLETLQFCYACIERSGCYHSNVGPRCNRLTLPEMNGCIRMATEALKRQLPKLQVLPLIAVCYEAPDIA